MSKKLTKRQIKLAAKIYSLSVLAQGVGVASTDDEYDVLKLAEETAKIAIFKLCPEIEWIPLHASECIEIARSMV